MAKIDVKVLSESEVKDIHEASLTILRDTGVMVHHEGALKLLGESGAKIDKSNNIARLGERLVMDSVAGAGKKYILYGRDHEKRVRFGYGDLVQMSSPGQYMWVDSRTNKRRAATVQDARDAIRLGDALENINIVGAMAQPEEIGESWRSVFLTGELVKGTGKPSRCWVFTGEQAKYILEIYRAAAGGEEALRREPMGEAFLEPISPLQLPKEGLSIVKQFAQAGQAARRRDFLRATTTLLVGLVLTWLCVGCTASKPSVARFGIVSDCHYADKDSANSRCYRESLAKLAECVEVMNKQEVDFLIELGDFIDEGADEASTICYVQAIEGVFRRFRGPVYHVPGNHDISVITKDEFFSNVKNTGIVPFNSRYYSFDLKGLHIVVLDGNYLADGTDCGPGNFEWMDTNIPADELKWFKAELCSTDKPVIVFIHQRLDGSGSFYVNNSADVRQIMEDSGKVLVVFQGHHHEGGYSRIGGIHYYTLRAMVENSGQENNSYAVIEVHTDGSISVFGYRKAVEMELGAKCEMADK